jgi:perosamine synthetase
MIPIFDPYISKSGKNNVLQALNENWISSQGMFIKKFETKLAEFHSSKYSLVTSNCTSALHLSLLALGLKKGDEVICPALTFIAPANMVLLANYNLKLVDIDSGTLTIDPIKLKKKITKKTKALIVVHQFGHSAHMDEIMSICKKNKIFVIEDNAESLGGKYKGKLLGTFGNITTLSFFANKILTTGEGGAIITNSRKYYNLCLQMRDHGMSLKKKYFHTRLGFNYRMTNLQAAIGLSQILEYKKIIDIRNRQLKLYYSNLKNLEKYIEIRSFQKWCHPVHWLMTIKIKKIGLRNSLLKFMREKGVDCRQMVNPVFEALYLKKKFNPKEFPNASIISKNSLHLPSGTSLTKNNIEYVCNTLKAFFIKNFEKTA